MNARPRRWQPTAESHLAVEMLLPDGWEIRGHQRIRSMVVIVAQRRGITYRAQMNRPGADDGQLCAPRLLDDCQRNGLQIVSTARGTRLRKRPVPLSATRVAMHPDRVSVPRSAEIFGFSTRYARDIKGHRRHEEPQGPHAPPHKVGPVRRRPPRQTSCRPGLPSQQEGGHHRSQRPEPPGGHHLSRRRA